MLQAFSPGDIVYHAEARRHVGRVAAVFPYPSATIVRVRWGATRWIADESASDLTIIVKEATLFARLAANRETVQ